MNEAEMTDLLARMERFGVAYFGDDDDFDGSNEWSDFIQTKELVKSAIRDGIDRDDE